MAKKQRHPKPFPHLCPECGETAVYAETTDYSTAFKYEGHLHEFGVPGITLNKCRACGGVILPNEALDQIAEAFRRHVHLLTAQQIRDEIQKLEFSQKDFAELLGVAPETVSRWLTNVQIQTRSLDRLMRLFFKSEELRKDLADMNLSAPAQAEQIPTEDETPLTPCSSQLLSQATGGRGEQIMLIRGRIQNGVVVLETDASVPEGAEVAVVVPAAPRATSKTAADAERQRAIQIMDRIAALPIEAADEPFSGADHDKALYGP